MSNKVSRSSFAVFPFLKTTAPVSIGEFTLRGTDDPTELDPEQAEQLREIAQMLFLQDDLRIQIASFTIIPFVDLSYAETRSKALTSLERLQAVVAYCYAAPHNIFGDPFLSHEHASLAVFSPGEVSIYSVQPEHDVEVPELESKLKADERGYVPGYAGIYNFKHPFWVVKGSRLYPPVPQLPLNISQNLAADFGQNFLEPHYRALLRLIQMSDRAVSDRVLTAIRWFNAANSLSADEESAIVSLAVAFETLLGLPEGEKTGRITDAISLLLGRVSRLDIWADQFYSARSEIVHEGRAKRLHFIATDSAKTKSGKNADEASYRSLLSYGRQVFQLCVGSVLFGAEMAEKAGLEEKLVTNQERFEHMCRVLSDESLEAAQRLRDVEHDIEIVDRYRSVQESNLKIGTMLDSLRLATGAFLLCEPNLEGSLRESFEPFQSLEPSTDPYPRLEALYRFQELASLIRPKPTDSSPRAITIRLAEVLWRYLGLHYYWLKQEREKAS